MRVCASPLVIQLGTISPSETALRNYADPRPSAIPLFDYIAEPDRAYYKKVFEDLLAHSRSWGRLYECSSPSDYRQFHMRVLPLMEPGGLMVINSIRMERPHDRISCAAIEERFRNPNE